MPPSDRVGLHELPQGPEGPVEGRNSLLSIGGLPVERWCVSFASFLFAFPLGFSLEASDFPDGLEGQFGGLLSRSKAVGEADGEPYPLSSEGRGGSKRRAAELMQ